MLPYNYYDYKDLRAAAVKPGATQEDINALGEWFHLNGSDFWNGESYDADNGLRLYPVYQPIDDDDSEIIGYEFG